MADRKERISYNASVNYDVLKSLEGTTLSNCLELVKRVILIDGEPYDSEKIKLTTGRKNEFLRLIEYHAIVEFFGIKCHIKIVFDNDTLGTINNIQTEKRLNIIKNS